MVDCLKIQKIWYPTPLDLILGFLILDNNNIIDRVVWDLVEKI